MVKLISEALLAHPVASYYSGTENIAIALHDQSDQSLYILYGANLETHCLLVR